MLTIEAHDVTYVYLDRYPDECNMCGYEDFLTHCVPWYCGPVSEMAEQEVEIGYKTVCKKCYAKWEKWNDGQCYQGA
jgi:hypothetical protein